MLPRALSGAARLRACVRGVYIKGKGHQGLVDRIQIKTIGGRGGNGVNSFQKLTCDKRIPTGGSGGNGGSVFIESSWEVRDLKLGSSVFRGSEGGAGTGHEKDGPLGADLVVRVPIGTLLTRLSDVHLSDLPGELPEVSKQVDLQSGRRRVLVARGDEAPPRDRPVRGRDRLRAGAEEHRGRGPGGLPERGQEQSSGRADEDAAQADYPFTTLIPTVGCIEYSDFTTISVADIPGLVEGASENRGLGHEFLRHIERTSALLFVIDAAGSPDPAREFELLRNELMFFNPAMAGKPALIAANKIDLGHNVDWEALARRTGCRVFPISTRIPGSLGPLALRLRSVVRDGDG